MKTAFVLFCFLIAILGGIENILRPQNFKSGFDDAYLQKKWFLFIVRLSGVIIIFLGFTVLFVYFFPRSYDNLFSKK